MSRGSSWAVSGAVESCVKTMASHYNYSVICPTPFQGFVTLLLVSGVISCMAVRCFGCYAVLSWEFLFLRVSPTSQQGRGSASTSANLGALLATAAAQLQEFVLWKLEAKPIP